jgi:transposase-like protein
MREIWLWLFGFPKCKNGGRCNYYKEMEYSFKSGRYFEKSNRFKCDKCGKETTEWAVFNY